MTDINDIAYYDFVDLHSEETLKYFGLEILK